jgi:hypothetical protein
MSDLLFDKAKVRRQENEVATATSLIAWMDQFSDAL